MKCLQPPIKSFNSSTPRRRDGSDNYREQINEDNSSPLRKSMTRSMSQNIRREQERRVQFEDEPHEEYEEEYYVKPSPRVQ
jgi:hypothetical protein